MNKVQALLREFKETLLNKLSTITTKSKNNLKKYPSAERIRSKARWHEFGEQSTKYLEHLEHRNYLNKSITKLMKPNGNIITHPDEILDEQKNCNENLYASQKPDINDLKFGPFLRTTILRS